MSHIELFIYILLLLLPPPLSTICHFLPHSQDDSFRCPHEGSLPHRSLL
jgi:hypothetical protein